MNDGELDWLNDTYRFLKLVFVSRGDRIFLFRRGTDGEPTGDVLRRFEDIDKAEKWMHARVQRGR